MTVRKALSLVLTFLGCLLVTGILSQANHTTPLRGILLGLGAGFGYALYSIFGKYALAKYSSLTFTTYTFLCASLALVPASRILSAGSLLLKPQVIIYGMGMGLFSTVLAFFFYSKGLAAIESSRASIIAMVEPVVATLIGTLFFGEALGLLQVLGISLVIIAVIIVQGGPEEPGTPQSICDMQNLNQANQS